DLQQHLEVFKDAWGQPIPGLENTPAYITSAKKINVDRVGAEAYKAIVTFMLPGTGPAGYAKEFLIIKDSDGTITAAISVLQESGDQDTFIRLSAERDGKEDAVQSALLKILEKSLSEMNPASVDNSIEESHRVFAPFITSEAQRYEFEELLAHDPVAMRLLTQAQIFGKDLTVGGRVYAINEKTGLLYDKKYNAVQSNIFSSLDLGNVSHEAWHAIFERWIARDSGRLADLKAYLEANHADILGHIAELDGYTYIN
ncbi:unnamed protein product, partial [marine sediment metagenome]